MILHVDVQGVSGEVSLRQRGGDVRDARMDVVGKVLRTEFVGRGKNAVRVTIEIDEAARPGLRLRDFAPPWRKTR